MQQYVAYQVVPYSKFRRALAIMHPAVQRAQYPRAERDRRD